MTTKLKINNNLLRLQCHSYYNKSGTNLQKSLFAVQLTTMSTNRFISQPHDNTYRLLVSLNVNVTSVFGMIGWEQLNLSEYYFLLQRAWFISTNRPTGSWRRPASSCWNHVGRSLLRYFNCWHVLETDLFTCFFILKKSFKCNMYKNTTSQIIPNYWKSQIKIGFPWLLMRNLWK